MKSYIATHKFSHRVNILLYAIALLLGLIVIIGWNLQVLAIVRGFPGLAPMQYNNALCFILLGSAGLAYQFENRRALLFFALLGFLISGLTLLQYLVQTDFGIDLLLMNTNELIPTAHPGRMAPNSAFTHVMAFISLLLLFSKKVANIRWASWVGATVAASGVVSLAGYLIDLDGGFSWGKYTQMAVHTSAGFVVVGSALGVTTIPKRMRIEGGKFSLWPYEVILLATVFLIDMQLPQGVAVGLLYVMPLLLSWYFPNRKQIVTVAVICNLLIMLDIFLATDTLDSEAVAYNRVMSVLAVWISASIFYYLKRVSEKQKESDLKFKLAVDGTTAGIWDWINVDEDEQWWSPKFYELLGLKNQEIEARISNLKELLHPEDLEYTFKLVQRHFEKKSPFLIEYRLLHKSGKYRWFQGAGKATWNEDGVAQRMVGTIIDIHARKLAEIAEEERTLQLSQKNKELEEFTYVASHDLQEPVRTISSFVGLFKDTYADKLDEEAKQYLDFIDGASKRSQQLIIDLLDYSRIGKDRKIEPVDLNNVLKNVLTDLTVRIEESEATINVSNLPTIEGQATELRLLFQNLISNAIKFQNKSVPPKINIGVKTSEEEYVFSVSDNGIGIEEKYMNKIFVIFKRLHSKSEFEGTGIGLAHSKKVVELHGGRIWVESKLGEGSVFHIAIPKTNQHKE